VVGRKVNYYFTLTFLNK